MSSLVPCGSPGIQSLPLRWGYPIAWSVPTAAPGVFAFPIAESIGSWLNLVERWFAELTNKQLRRGVYRSVAQLKAAIREFIDTHHANPKPFVWTKTADQILDSIARFAQRTLDLHAAPLIERTTRSGH
jgi:hypothetical protein